MENTKIKMRIKEQRLLKKQYEITKNDCQEFVRIIKKYSDSFSKSDLIEYCKNNKILICEETLSCMFDEINLNSKTKLDEISSLDLFNLISVKKKRSFYVPIVFFIGKPNYLYSYEQKLKKDKQADSQKKQIEKEKLTKQIKKDLKLKEEKKTYISRNEIYNTIEQQCNDISNTNLEQCTSTTEIKNENHLIQTETTEGDIVKEKETEEEKEKKKEKENEKEKQSSDTEENVLKRETIEEKNNGKIEQVSKDKPVVLPDTKHSKKKFSISNENNRLELLKDGEKEKRKEKNKKKNRKSTHSKINRNSEHSEEKITKATEEEPPNKENKESINSEKKNKYEFLLQKVLYSEPKIRKKPKYLKSFHLVLYFKLNELIYLSFLITSFYDYFYRKELDDLAQLYESALYQEKKKEKNGKGGATTKQNKVNLIDITKRYKYERKKAKINIYSNNVNKYVNSDVLTNFDFIQENLNDILSTILNNLNIFFNRNINDIDEIITKYNAVVNDILKKETQKENEKKEEIEEKKEKRVNEMDGKPGEEEKEMDKVEKESNKNNNTKKNTEKNEKNKQSNQSNQNDNESCSYHIDTPHVFKTLKKKKKNRITSQIKKHNSCINISVEKNAIKQYYVEPSVDKENVKTSFGNSFTTFFNFLPEERDVVSDADISYLESKYSKEEVEELKKRNIPFELTQNINEIKVYKKTYFHDFFFLYVVRKMFWNVFGLYNLYLTELSVEKKGINEQMGYSENENLIVYESDISVNNLKKDKSRLYNTNELLSTNLKSLFRLIKTEKLLIYLRYDKNKKIKNKNKTEYIYKDIWIYLVLTALNKKNNNKILNYTFNDFILFKGISPESVS